MKKPIEIWQAVVGTVLLLLTIGTIIGTQASKITNLQDRLIEAEKQADKVDTRFDRIDASIERVNQQVTQLRVDMQDKENRSDKQKTP